MADPHTYAKVLRERRHPGVTSLLRRDLRAEGSVWLSALAFLALYGVLTAPLLWRVPNDLTMTYESLVLAAGLALLSAVDLRTYRLPDALTIPLAACGMAVSLSHGFIPALWSAASAAIGLCMFAGLGAVYRRVRGRDGLGLGDAKLLSASGAWLGAEAFPTLLLWATGTAIVCVLIAYCREAPLSGATKLPFGPFLGVATWLVWLYGPL